MIGLIKKDLLMIKSNLKLVIIIFAVLFVMSLQGEFDISFVPPFIVVMLFMSTFSYDEYNKWDAYAITLPNGRKSVVTSKYLATLILIAISIIITIVLNIIVGLINNNINLDSMLPTMIGCFFGIILVEAIIYPFIFKYGIEKGRIGLFIGSFVIVGVISFIKKATNINISTNIVNFFEAYWYIIIPILFTGFLYISYCISKKIYLKKEF